MVAPGVMGQPPGGNSTPRDVAMNIGQAHCSCCQSLLLAENHGTTSNVCVPAATPS